MRFAIALLIFPLSCLANPHEQEIQRALIQLDQRSADFARQRPGDAPYSLPPDIGRPLHPDPAIAQQLRPYERQRIAREREYVLELPPPLIREPKSGSDPNGTTLR